MKAETPSDRTRTVRKTERSVTRQAISESAEQIELFRWAAYQSGKYPELCLLYHIPNGGKRSKTEAARFRMEGVKAGVPDLCLPAARGGFHGLYIEMKRAGGRPSPEQRKWIEELTRQGYKAAVCYGCEDAVRVMTAYLKGEAQ